MTISIFFQCLCLYANTSIKLDSKFVNIKCKEVKLSLESNFQIKIFLKSFIEPKEVR